MPTKETLEKVMAQIVAENRRKLEIEKPFAAHRLSVLKKLGEYMAERNGVRLVGIQIHALLDASSCPRSTPDPWPTLFFECIGVRDNKGPASQVIKQFVPFPSHGRQGSQGSQSSVTGSPCGKCFGNKQPRVVLNKRVVRNTPSGHATKRKSLNRLKDKKNSGEVASHSAAKSTH